MPFVSEFGIRVRPDSVLGFVFAYAGKAREILYIFAREEDRLSDLIRLGGVKVGPGRMGRHRAKTAEREDWTHSTRGRISTHHDSAPFEDALRPLFAERTSVVIAHRLSTILAGDVILVFDRGRLVKEGNHSTLLAGGTLYAELYERQFAGAEDVAEPISMLAAGR